jgi:hypothetical protein
MKITDKEYDSRNHSVEKFVKKDFFQLEIKTQ